MLQPHKFNNEVFGLSMFVLHGKEDKREEVDKENRVQANKVEKSGLQVCNFASLQELEKRLERAAPPRQQTKLSSTLQVISIDFLL